MNLFLTYEKKYIIACSYVDYECGNIYFNAEKKFFDILKIRKIGIVIHTVTLYFCLLESKIDFQSIIQKN